ncbi:cell cycle checkpoint protein RAD17 isoform X1 [Xiphophorus couchianus]|uniref:cell cycle checkpoint protein RAD17 isoform X1 n=1 Tax=Xiphophorus couchianus TaxID=32473 RepID=UPI0010171E3F|nr:cell cycle checkpoint protein RAD17 isoform X1 [Xiphophorus couchianus]
MKKFSLGDKVNNWVDPSFSDTSAKSEDKQIWGFQSEERRSRKWKEDQNGSLWMMKSNERGPDEPWVDKYSPCSQGELAVHKKKTEEVEKWMRTHTKATKGGILILTGPSGSGKTATVQVLSTKLGVRVQEWTNPASAEPYLSSLSEWRSQGLSCSSQLAQFQEFLLRVNKYKCLKMKGERGAAEIKLILVEDFPNQFYRQPCSFHDTLRVFVRNSQCPLVIIVSGSRSGEGSLWSLFPKEIQEELHMSCISFNPVPATTMMKVLKNIVYMEAEKQSHKSLYVPEKAELEMLCSGSSGDIRSAINSLQFCCLLEKGLCTLKKPPAMSLKRAAALSKQKGKRAKSAKEQEEHQAIGGKDVSFFLFRALGKILHCKRGNGDCPNESKGASGLVLPFHLLQHHREVLLVQPELVVERSETSGEFFTLCLHQNYLDFFSDIEDVDRASEYLSDADLLTGNWMIRHIIGDYGSSVATRGLIHSNSCQLPVGFRPLHKPSWCLVNKKHQDNCVAAQSLFKSFCLTPVGLQTQLLPFLAKLSNPTRSQAQMAVIQDVGQMSLRTCSGRLKLENLRDKEMGQEIEEEEELHSRVEKGLQVSQSHLLTNQALLEEEEVVIEEYDSD